MSLKVTYCILFFFLITFSSIGQENPTPPPEFPLGTFLSGNSRTDSAIYNSLYASGLNTVIQYANESTQPFLSLLNLIALNQDNPNQWIDFYATGYYSKWEAEEYQTDPNKTGVKHQRGKMADFNGIHCWSITGAPACSVMYGPHYTQGKLYRRSFYDTDSVTYTARFNMALDNNGADSNEVVCNIFVRSTYMDGDERHAEIIKGPKTLKVSDFPIDSFAVFYLGPPSDRSYSYTAYLDSNKNYLYNDEKSNTGVEFCVDWLRNDTLCTLYIDNAEVYDNHGWNEFADDPQGAADTIKAYAQSFSNWPNLKYWYGADEPPSLDSYTPMRVVDSLVYDTVGIHVITTFFPFDQVTVNGDSQLVTYYRRVNPEHLMIDHYPFTSDNDPIKWEELEGTRLQLQIAGTTQKGFWYVAQSWGVWDYETGDWCWRRRPDSTELKSTVMLALAHGAKGIFFWNYDSYTESNQCDHAGYYDCIIDLPDSNYKKSDLWYVIRDNFVPRLKGRLGDKLLGLTYTGNYLSARYITPPDDPSPQTFEYLTLPYTYQAPTAMNWHAGFFKRNGYDNDKYFFLVNLLPETNDSVLIGLTPPVSGYTNFRFRNYEGYFDTTFTTSEFTCYLSQPAGEGYLYEVAPVVEYGGKLYASETISSTTTLYDDMIIENSVVLTVNAEYNCYGNIHLKGSGQMRTTNGGTITFHNGKGIIAERYSNISGTSSHKLILDFGSTGSGTGIQILQEAQLMMNYCILKNAVNLVSCNTSRYQASINHCDFQNTSGYAVSLSGISTNVPSINYCTFNKTDFGIFAAGQSSIRINQNTFTNNILAINLSQIPGVQIIGNTISSDLDSLPGIFLSSCNGSIRTNEIYGHTIGISVGNSSPVIGDNHIKYNKVNGIYIGPGSVPDLRGATAGRPPNVYPISGYNEIKENGGYTILGQGAPNDDGSEIFFDHSNAQLNHGCNLIADDRRPSPPLQTTLYLMNGAITSDWLYATHNAWGDTVYPARFGNLPVVFFPYNEKICDLPIAGGFLVIKDNDENIIDTVYSAGPPDYTLSSVDLSYSEAALDMINRDYPSADIIYNSIISSAPTDTATQTAYLELYKSARLQNADSTDLAALRDLFNSNLPEITDSVMNKIVSQLSLLTLVDEKQYNDAIAGFGDIINQNPETEEAMFAEIDAMTTSLLANNGNDSTLGKSMYKRLLVKGSLDMQNRMNELIQSRFGAKAKTEGKDIIPNKYLLYNNYPNPFNPTTTIRFDIPERTNVELSVYNILGQKIKTLIANESRNPGRYEVNFNGNSLASGVYVYRLITKNYAQSRKMLLIK